MSKLSFRARALDASKPLPVFRCEDLPDLHEYASINRAVPQMPTGMEKEEESVCFNGLNLWKYAVWLYFLFLNDRRRPSFFLRRLSQNGRHFFQQKHDEFDSSLRFTHRDLGVWAKRGCDLSLWDKSGRFYRHIYA